MSIEYTIFDTATGLIKRTIEASEGQIECNVREDEGYIEGRFDSLCQRVDLKTLEPTDYRPPSPSAEHEWDGRRWNLNAAAQAALDADSDARGKIRALEIKQPRAEREAVLGYEGALARLKAIDDEIIELRKNLKA